MARYYFSILSCAENCIAGEEATYQNIVIVVDRVSVRHVVRWTAEVGDFSPLISSVAMKAIKK